MQAVAAVWSLGKRPTRAEEMALTKLSDTMSLQMKMAGKEEQLTEKNSGFLQNINMAEGAVQNLLREFTERDHVLDGPDEEDGIFSENPQSDFLHEVETTQWGMLQLEAENDQDLLSEQAEQGVDQAQFPHIHYNFGFIPFCLKEKIMEIKKQLGKIDDKFVQNFCKDISLMNTKLGMYQTQEGKTDPLSPEEMEPLLPQVLRPPLGQNSPPRITTWKRALRIFILFYGLTFAGLSCYILFLDPTFVFERTLPTILRRHKMWELREIIAPVLNLKVEDLLPS
ncbi:Single-Pass Membrane And Coiled-Coil Domain-Containing Protein 2 [Manis pentadactyla]|nr:Single-Pass Membrane And Coiled-Coil Domain-Containing Protein 2 [Manis pentadactyla]